MERITLEQAQDILIKLLNSNVLNEGQDREICKVEELINFMKGQIT